MGWMEENPWIVNFNFSIDASSSLENDLGEVNEKNKMH